MFGQDGKTLDVEASARKVAEAYGHLEKRLGGGDVAPASVDGYKVNVPESFKDTIKAEDLAAAPGVKALLADLHAAGASQKVVDSAVGAFLREGSKLREAQPQMAMAECEATLRQADGWKSDTEYEQQVRTAFNAGTQIFGKDFEGLVKDYGNDPRFIRGLAGIGREMQEDLPPSPEAQAQVQESIDTLMNSPAYLNAADPQHAATVAKVEAMTKQLVGTKPVASGRTHSFKT